MTAADSMTLKDPRMGLLLEFANAETNAKLVFEDDGKTGYAYLIVDGKMVGDVWLYNACTTPSRPEWSDPENMPFSNSAEYVSEEEFDPIVDSSEVAVEWDMDPSGPRVALNLRGKTHAVLRPGAKPGWCRLAARESPLAKPLHEAH